LRRQYISARSHLAAVELSRLAWAAALGFDEAASELAQKSVGLFRASWDDKRLCPKNFNSVTGVALDQPDTDGFYSWGALLPLLCGAEMMDVTPWRSWEICK
jgi:putative isomerase